MLRLYAARYETAEFLDVMMDNVRESLKDMVFAGELEEDSIDDVQVIYLYGYYHAEQRVAHALMKIRNAGAIFIGEYSSEPLGDYFAGPNHVLPTNGTARFFSALCVDDFIKKSSIISYSKEALENVHKDIETFATCEQLTAHANSIKVRFEGV